MSATEKRILIADDEPDILEIINYNLQINGYEVQTAKDGDEAIQKAKAKFLSMKDLYYQVLIMS